MYLMPYQSYVKPSFVDAKNGQNDAFELIEQK